MKKKIKEYITLGLSLSLFSYLLNFVWESLHSAYLYTCCNFEAKLYVKVMAYASMIDTFFIIGLYVFVALLYKNVFWVKKINRRQVAIIFFGGLILATLIEIRAIKLGIWNYSLLMPTVFGIGLSPLLQLSVTGLLAIWITNKMLS